MRYCQKVTTIQLNLTFPYSKVWYWFIKIIKKCLYKKHITVNSIYKVRRGCVEDLLLVLQPKLIRKINFVLGGGVLLGSPDMQATHQLEGNKIDPTSILCVRRSNNKFSIIWLAVSDSPSVRALLSQRAHISVVRSQENVCTNLTHLKLKANYDLEFVRCQSVNGLTIGATLFS